MQEPSSDILNTAMHRLEKLRRWYRGGTEREKEGERMRERERVS
jgi:hypothetical protein